MVCLYADKKPTRLVLIMYNIPGAVEHEITGGGSDVDESVNIIGSEYIWNMVAI